MNDPADHPDDAAALEEAVARTDRDGVAVRKVTTLHGPEAVAVYFTIRSTRADRATVRVVDPLPEAVRDSEVEFHPKYDPVNWTRAEDAVVYAAEVPPDGNRTTVYGVVVDDPDQLDLFDVEPSVEITSTEAPTTGEDAFSFGGATDRSAGEDVEPAGDDAHEAPAPPEEPEPATDAGAEPAAEEPEPGAVEALVSEVRRRDLTEPERLALLRALGLDHETDLGSLREEVVALRDEVASADRQAADVDRLESQLESLSAALDERYAELSAELVSLREAVERGAEWRDQVRESMSFEPRPPDPDDRDRRHSEL